MTPVLIAIALGVAFLFIFYQAVRLQWPAAYFAASDVAAYAVSQSPLRYAVFRLGPVFATCLFAAVTLDRAKHSGPAGAIGIGILHSLMTQGWGLVQASRWSGALWRHRVPILIIRAVILIAIIATSVLAAALADPLAPLVPPLEEVSTALWTAVAAGVVGGFIVNVSRGHGTSADDLTERAVQRIPEHLWNLAEDVAKAAGADATLVRAVMVVEDVQRPPWFRRGEHLKSYFMHRGTYGIMQVESEGWLSDEESIRKAVAVHFAGVVVKGQDGWLNYEAVQEFGRRYNPNPNFVDLLIAAYNRIDQSVREA